MYSLVWLWDRQNHSETLLSGGATPAVCGPSGACYLADGVDSGQCYEPYDVQFMRDLPWGEYKFKVSGAVGTGSGAEKCWEKKFDILVGAGPVNPQQMLDLPRISTEGKCRM
jgi:hypothetical protein